MIRVLHYSDIESGYDSPERIARLAQLLQTRRTSSTVVVGTGDNIAPSAISLVTDGRQSLDFFEAVEPDADVLGNHDFDHSIDAVRGIVADTSQEWLAGNVLEEGQQFGDAVGIRSHATVEVEGATVGLVGVSHPETGEMNPEASSLTFTDVRSTVERGIAAVRRSGAEYVIVLAHVGQGSEGGASGPDLASELDADVVLDGHDHDPTVGVRDGTVYVRSGQGGRTVSEIDLHEAASADVRTHDVSEAPIDETVKEALLERARAANMLDVVDELSEPIPCDRRSSYAGESRIGNFVTDAYRHVADADVGIQIPGGIRPRADLSGPVKVWDLIALVPFDDDLVTLQLSGDRLFDAIERVSMDPIPGGREWYFGHVSGISFTYDEREEDPRSVTVGGEPLDPSRDYTVGTTEYFVRSDHIFPGFEADDVVRRYGPQYRAVVEYARSFGVAPELEDRITKVR